MPVAIKYWNGAEWDGLQCLKNEIEILEYLHVWEEETWGVVPRVIAVRKSPPYDYALMTEFVGDAIVKEYNERNEPIAMWIGDVPVSVNEISALQEAGAEALRTLHRAGVIHGDLKVDNIRVKREDDGKCGVKWHVWLIDFGLATRVFTENGRRHDEYMMRESLHLIAA